MWKVAQCDGASSLLLTSISESKRGSSCSSKTREATWMVWNGYQASLFEESWLELGSQSGSLSSSFSFSFSKS